MAIASPAPGQEPRPQREPDVPYVPTSDGVVAAMLKAGGVKTDDILYDLGCGDGRIVIAAAQKLGTRGVGIDINPVRIKEAQANAEKAGVTGRVPIDFLVSNTPETRAVAEVVQSMAAEAGFDLKLRVTEVATALKQGEDGDFQLYMNTWSGRSDPDGNSVIYQTCGAPQNMGHYCDKEVDAWHQEARAVSDPAARKAIYEKGR